MTYREHIAELFLWITGRPWVSNKKPELNVFGVYTIRKTPPPLWECAPLGDYFMLTLSSVKAPNIFHRVMQRICFGVRYRRIKAAPIPAVWLDRAINPLTDSHSMAARCRVGSLYKTL